MKEIEVVAAVIFKNNKVFATQRGYGDFKGGWEFPGGKIEPGETHVQALSREIREELGVEIEINDLIKTIEYDYPNFHLKMHCYKSYLKTGNPVLLEHQDSVWVDKHTINDLNWLPADIEIVDCVKNKILN